MTPKNLLRFVVLSSLVVSSGLACKGGGGGGGGAPLAPLGIAASVMSPSEVLLSWLDQSTNETGFKIERAPDNGGTPGDFAVVGAAAKDATSFADSGLMHSTTYHYRVRATINGVDSAPTGGAMVRTGWIVEIAAGHDHAIFRRSDGTLWAFGYNGEGELGDGTFSSSVLPVQVSGLSDVEEISAGDYHTLARKPDGTVWAWGYNVEGAIGNGGFLNQNAPVQVPLTDIVDVGAGRFHSLALKSDGTVWAWGFNSEGQLGDGTTAAQPSPVQVQGLSDVQAVGGGYGHSVALKTDGTVWAWGDSLYGQLGHGFFTDSTSPVQVTGLTDVVAIVVGSYHTLALKSDGTVWAWGYGIVGALGDGSFNDSNVPVQVSGLANAVEIFTGNFHSAAKKADGSFVFWGYNSIGLLGDGTFNDQNAPVPGPAIGTVKAVALGPDSSFALFASGEGLAWGSNEYGNLGFGVGVQLPDPIAVSGFSGAAQIDGGDGNTVARKIDGTVWAWGENDDGEAAVLGGLPVIVPTQVAGLSGAIFVSAGDEHALAVLNDGTVRAWGDDGSGQLGDDGTLADQVVPVVVFGLTDIIAVAGGENHSLGLKSDGTVWAWGSDLDGQLGDDVALANKSTPVAVATITGIIAVAAGEDHSLALKSDGTVWAWGEDDDGQLGDSVAFTDQPTPVQVAVITDVIAIAAGEDHSLALKSDGTVWAWGEDDDGQLGDDGASGANRATPVQVAGLSDVIAIAAAGDFCLALKSDGTVWVWGENNDFEGGQGIVGGTADLLVPTQVPGLAGVAAISAGNNTAHALVNDGTLRAWGETSEGQSGTGAAAIILVPVPVLHPAP